MRGLSIALLFFVFFFVLCMGIYFIFFNKVICNDGTLNNDCSRIKPYFCSKGMFIEKASLCGCDNTSMIESEGCVSVYQSESRNITLNYTLRGNKGEINFTVYKKLTDYLSTLPRYIDSSKNPTLLDFKLKLINEEQQRELLLPLVISIENITRDKTDQARIAISIIQNIPFGASNKTIRVGNGRIDYQRYPYEVLYDMKGICSEKSALLIFLLREIGYGTSSLYYHAENHEAVGIKCPKGNSLNNTMYCFVETTGPSIITDDKTEYFGVVRQLNSLPEVINISDGISLGKNLYEYRDAKLLTGLRNIMERRGVINPIQNLQFSNLVKTYGLIVVNNTYVF